LGAEKIRETSERGDRQVLGAALDALEVLHVHVELRGELVLRHAAPGAQLGDPPPEVMKHLADVPAHRADGSTEKLRAKTRIYKYVL
jgi:hypothetical protein